MWRRVGQAETVRASPGTGVGREAPALHPALSAQSRAAEDPPSEAPLREPAAPGAALELKAREVAGSGTGRIDPRR
ncbi:MAG: hypothetical protein WKF29_07455, partial [Thermoleophilaceae bacterium]